MRLNNKCLVILIFLCMLSCLRAKYLLVDLKETIEDKDGGIVKDKGGMCSKDKDCPKGEVCLGRPPMCGRPIKNAEPPKKYPVDPRYAPFWTRYAKDYMQQLKKYNFDQDSKTLMAWVKKFQTYDKDFAFHQKMVRNDGREAYGRCVLYSTCTGQKGVVLRKNEACIPNDRRRLQKDCVKEDPKSKLFELQMIGWGPHQYVPIHDHPDGGCMIKVAKGPGLKETLYRFLPTVSGQSRQYFCCQQRNITITGKDHCPSYEGVNSYGCQVKGFSVQNMFQLETFMATRGGEYEVKTLKGDEVMHELWNPFNETTYQLSHYLGDFTRITFWFPDDYEHDIKCTSRGDDPRLESNATLRIGEGCNTCSP